MQPILSILICHLYKRAGMLGALLRSLQEQIDSLNAQDKVEILIKADNGELATGTKRNHLLLQAKGEYTIFTDDDDSVPEYYVEELLNAAKSGADCFAINGIMTTDGKKEEKWFISKDYPYKAMKDSQGNTYYLRYTHHITAVRSSIAKQILFPDTKFGEDFKWATSLKNSGLLKTEAVIKKPLYHYKYLTVK